MTARRKVLVLATVAIVACRGERAKPSAVDREFAQMAAEVVELDPVLRGKAARFMNNVCCGRIRGWENHQARACSELARFFSAERDVRALDAIFDEEYCPGVIPPESLATICREIPCSMRARGRLAGWLSQVPPSPAIVEALLLLARGVNDPYERRQAANRFLGDISLAIAQFGEPDLGPLVAALSSEDKGVQLAAVRGVLVLAMKGPLELPQVLPVLDRIGASAKARVFETVGDREAAPEDIAELARSAAELYREASRGDPDVAAKELLAYDRDLRILGVRQFSCRASGIEDALEELTKDADSERAARAAEALALRRVRCRK